MKTILFLQGSPFYDLSEAEKRLQSIDKLFYEKAIVYGRVGLFVPMRPSTLTRRLMANCLFPGPA